jgi:HK97 family phage major capsid protein
MTPTTRDLLEQRSTIVTRMRTLTDKPAGDGGDLSDDQAKDFERMKGELTSLEGRIERQQVLDDAERRIAAPAIIRGNGSDGRFEERARDFSLVRAINAQLGDPVDAGFEREISAEVRHRNPTRSFQGIAVPDQYFTVEKRTLLVGAAAAPLYPEQHRGDLFIDMLRSSLVVGQLGATILDGLVGTQDIPKQTGSSTAQWVAEDGPLTETDATFTDVELSPKTVGAMTSFSRRTLINAVPSIEQIVRRDLSAVIARAIDNAALLGTGASNTPTGIASTAGINTPTLAGPTWAQVLAFISAIESENADLGSQGWAMSPAALAKLRSVTKVTSDAGAGFLADSPTSMAGYPVVTSSSIPLVTTTHQVFYGSWSQLLVGYWSGLDVLANPFEATAYSRGRVLIRAMRDVDVAVRHAKAFARATNMPA